MQEQQKLQDEINVMQTTKQEQKITQTRCITKTTPQETGKFKGVYSVQVFLARPTYFLTSCRMHQLNIWWHYSTILHPLPVHFHTHKSLFPRAIQCQFVIKAVKPTTLNKGNASNMNVDQSEFSRQHRHDLNVSCVGSRQQ